MRLVWLSQLKMYLLCALLGSLLLSWCGPTAQSQVVPLWPKGAPGSEGKTLPETVRVTPQGDHVVSGVNSPSITVYLPREGKASGAGVVVIPGGGHREIWIDHEGYRVAAWLSEHGVAAFVLKYRLAREAGSTYTIEGTELNDTKRAIRLLRSRASEWGLNPDHIGVIGFSAGGQLAELVSTRYDAGELSSSDPIDSQSSRPDFQGLIYPGLPPDEAFVFSKQTPPAFLACGADDRPDISERLPELYLALKRVGVPVEMHIFAGVGHGFGIRSATTGNVAAWPELFYGWLNTEGFLSHR